MKLSLLSSLIAKVGSGNNPLSFALLETRKTIELEGKEVIFYVLERLLNLIGNLFATLVYDICKFALNIIDVLQVLAYKLIGISFNEEALVDPASPIFRFLLNEKMTKVIGLVFAVGIILLILLTIAAIVRSEYKNVTVGDDGRAKTRIFRRVLKSMFLMVLFPAVLLGSIIFTNAILASLMQALNVNPNSTVGSQIVATTNYNANNYRKYALSNQRIPILINFQDPAMYAIEDAGDYTADELIGIYSSWEETGKEIYNRFSTKDFAMFSDTLYYKNNVIHNNSSYDNFERFVCTPEQYLVLADFVDYALANNLEFFIKSSDDPDISYTYVSDVVFNTKTNALSIKYANSTKSIGSDDYYTIIYKSEDFEFSTPIQATLQSLTQILSIGEFSDYKFKLLERVDGDDIVDFKTEKTQIKLSEHYLSEPTATDQLILYEYYRKLSNNTFKDYFLTDLENGVNALKTMVIHHYVYNPIVQDYVEYGEDTVCLINGSYYLVEEKQEMNLSTGIVEKWYELDESILNNLTYYGDAQYEAEDGETEDVVYIECFNKRVKLETNNYGRAVLYNDLRSYFNSGDSRYSLTVESPQGVIPTYKDEIEDICVYGTWAEKIYNDLQVIYKEINVNNLINTEQWLSAFSMRKDATIENSNLDFNTFNTSLIHPLGLILSDLFLGGVKEGDYNQTFSDYVFESNYSEGIIKGLFISMLGETEYISAYQQYDAYMTLFNGMMANVLDEIAYYENFDLVDQQNESIDLFTYKAYLASALLSTDMAKYLTNIAKTMISANNLAYRLFNKTYNDDGTVNEVEVVSYEDLVKTTLFSPTYLKSLSEVKTNEEEREVVENEIAIYSRGLTENTHTDMPTVDEVLEYRTALYDLYLNNGVTGTLTERISYLRGTIGYSLSEDELIAIASSYPVVIDLPDLIEQSDNKVNKYENLIECIINNGLELNGAVIDEYKITGEVGEYVITEQSKRDILTSCYLNYDEVKSAVLCFQTVREYWEDQQEEHPDDVYEFMDSFYAYLNNSFARSWAFSTLTLSSAESAIIKMQNSNSSIFLDKNEQLLIDEAVLVSTMLTTETEKLSSVVAANETLIQQLKEKYAEKFIVDGVLVLTDEEFQAFLTSRAHVDELIKSFESYIKVRRVAMYVGFIPVLTPLLAYNAGPYSCLNNALDLFKYVTDTLVKWTDNYNYYYEKYSTHAANYSGGFNYIGQERQLNNEMRNLILSIPTLFDSRSEFYNACYSLFGTDLTTIQAFFEKDDEAFNIFDIVNSGNVDDVISADASKEVNREDVMHALQNVWTKMLRMAANGTVETGLAANSSEYRILQKSIADFVTKQTVLDALNIYSIEYTNSAYASQVLNSIMKFTVNNKTYSARVTITPGKFTELVLGYDYLKDRGFNVEYIDSNYEGILSQVTINTEDGKKTTTSTWAELRTFANKFGQACVDVNNKSTLGILSNERTDNFIISLYSQGERATDEQTLTNSLANMLLENLSPTTTQNLLGGNYLEPTIDNVKTLYANKNIDQRREFVIDALDYLGLTKEDVMFANNMESLEDNFAGFTLSEYKRTAMQVVYDYVAQANDSAFENQQRYLTLIYLICSEWESPNDITRWMKPGEQFAENYYSANFVKLKVDLYTIGLIMRMSGLENRSVTELVGLKFTIDLDPKVKSEENGYTFIVCTYDSEKGEYYPFMMTNPEFKDYEDARITDAKYSVYLNDKLHLSMPQTSYTGLIEYGSKSTGWFPVVFKGYVTDEGLPTTIKIENGNVVFYRNDPVIVSASKIGLSNYYDDTSMIAVRGGAISGVVNFFSEKITGKTLTETVVSTFPRIATDYSLKFAYGNSYNQVAENQTDKFYIDYNFNVLAGGVKLNNLFTPIDINIVILVFATIFIFKALWKLVWGLIQRIFNIVILTIIAPAVFATIPFTSEKKDKKSKQYVDDPWIYENWFKLIKMDVISVLGMAVGLNIFFVLVPLIKNVQIVQNANAFSFIPTLLPVNINFVNYILQTILLISAISAISFAPQLFSSIFGVTADIFSQGQLTLKNVSDIDKEVSNVLSGRDLIKAKDKAIGLVQNMVPLGAFASDVRKIKTKIQTSVSAKAAEMALIANGVDPKKAKELSKHMRDTMREAQNDVEARRQAQRNRYYNAAFDPDQYSKKPYEVQSWSKRWGKFDKKMR